MCTIRRAPARLEQRPRALDVDALHRRRVGARVAVERGEVEDRVAAVERAAQRVAVEQVARDESAPAAASPARAAVEARARRRRAAASARRRASR